MKRKKTLFTTSSPTLLASFSLMDISMLTVAKVQNVPELWMYHWVGMDVFEKKKKKKAQQPFPGVSVSGIGRLGQAEMEYFKRVEDGVCLFRPTGPVPLEKNVLQPSADITLSVRVCL